MMSSKQSPARIAILLPRFSRYGGVERFGFRLARALGERGYAVHFICARQEAEPPAGVRLVCVGRFGFNTFGKMLWFMLAAEYARRRGRYNLSIGLGKTLKQDLLRVSGGPEKLFWNLTKRIYPKGPKRVLKYIVRLLLEPQAPLKRFIERRQIRNAERIVMVSDLTLDWMLQTYPDLDRDKTLVFYNLPDTSGFVPVSADERRSKREALGFDEACKLVGFAGTGFERKGLRVCIQALSSLPDEYTLLVAGGRDPSVYLRLARQAGVEHRVRFLGAVEDMAGFYGILDAYVSPTLYDTCSNTVLEALACGVPTISSADDGSSFFVDKEFILQNPEDADDLAEKIKAAVKTRRTARMPQPRVPCGIEPYLQLIAEMVRAKAGGADA